MSHPRARQKYRFDLNRRRFLQQGASAAGGAALALASGKKSWYAWADAQAQRPHLIAIHLPGGWDTNWFHMAFPKSMVSTATDNPNLIQNMPATAMESGMPTTGTDPYGRSVDVDSNNKITNFYDHLYTERTISSQLVPHPTAHNHFLGLGAQNALGGDYSILSKVCIWKGIASGGAHLIPNHAIIHGNQSQYSIPFSGLIAASISAAYGKQMMNYVQLTATPTDFGANWAMSVGDEIPINIPNHTSLVQLTQRAPGDFTDPGLYSQLNSSIANLGSKIGLNKLTLQSSKTIYNQFMSAFTGAINISNLGSNMAPFLTYWAAYANNTLTRVADMHQAAFIAKISDEVVLPFQNQAYNYHLYAPYTPGLTGFGASAAMTTAGGPTSSNYAIDQPTINSYQAALTTPFTADVTSLNIGANGAFDAPDIRATIALHAWKFALAEFLIVNGYSSVVDIMIAMPDAHSDNSNELRETTIVYSLWAMLLTRLQAAGFLDNTLVVVFSEFDRTADIRTETSLTNRGTGHGSTESILLAGFGVKQGTVVGDRYYGPNGQSTPNDGPTPIEYQPGKVGVIDFQYPFPTIMQIFGVPIPGQQVTDATYVSAVMK
jgi:hypothetical protein